MESRKRPLADDEDLMVTKKRILTGLNGSPHVNGAAEQGDEAFGHKLESYRKEAIYRRMKHYSRENERSQVIIQQLEQRKSTCEAGLAAISACWAQLVDTIRLIVQPNDLPEVAIQADEIFNLTAHVENESKFKEALGETTNATQALITKFVQLGDSNHADLLQSQRFSEFQKVQNDRTVLRSQINLLRSKLEECETQKEQFYNALITAENRFERSQSASVQDIESRQTKEKGQESRKEAAEEVQRNLSPAVSPTIVASPNHSNGVHDTTEIEILQENIKHRDIKIAELEKEAALLKDQKTMLELDQKHLSVEQITESPYYKILLNHASHLEAALAEKSDQNTRLSDELVQLHGFHSEWEEGSITNLNQSIQELRTMLTKRDAENVRLREQREQQGAELNERRQKDSIKLASVQEYKSLVDSNSERINILTSELSRCKAQLAANAKSEDLMLFFLAGNIDQVRYFEGLKQRNVQAEARIAALEQTFATYQSEQPDIAQHMIAEAHAIEQLSRLKAELDKYQRTYGALSDHPPDLSQLAEQLRSKEEELQDLRLSERQRKESEASLFVELEKLSSLWEALDRQLKSKVFDLANMEDRLSKSIIEKAKSDNKYFAAMRDKEAIENERKNLARTLEKQGIAVDRLTDMEKHLRMQLNAQKEEAHILKKSYEIVKDKLVCMEKDAPELHLQLELEKKRFSDLWHSLGERDRSYRMLKDELKAKDDEIVRLKKDADRQIAQLKKETKTNSGNWKSDSEALELKHLRSLAICTTCKETYRSTIITKCMHTFCKGCVDARLSTRQRKCPACSIPFGQSDVHTFFYQ